MNVGQAMTKHDCQGSDQGHGLRQGQPILSGQNESFVKHFEVSFEN